MPLKTYPVPGTMAENVLAHIRANPQVSVNGIVKALSLNPSPARACLKALMDRKLITDDPTEDGHHRYTAADVKL